MDLGIFIVSDAPFSISFKDSIEKKNIGSKITSRNLSLCRPDEMIKGSTQSI